MILIIDDGRYGNGDGYGCEDGYGYELFGGRF